MEGSACFHPRSLGFGSFKDQQDLPYSEELPIYVGQEYLGLEIQYNVRSVQEAGRKLA